MSKHHTILAITLLTFTLAIGEEIPKQQPITREEAQEIWGKKTTFPMTGLSASELCSALTEIGQMLPPESRILDVISLGDGRLQITTGRRNAPIGGNGLDLIFEKKDGLWVETRRSRWVS